MPDQDEILSRLNRVEENLRVARLVAAAKEYQSDEQALLKAARSAFGAVILAVGGVVGTGIAATLVQAHDDAQSLVPFFCMGLAFSALALVAFVRMYRLDATARELGRVRRQMGLLDAHVSALPPDVAILIRSVATPKILTELGSTEPWSEPVWPDAKVISELLHRSDESKARRVQRRRPASPGGHQD